MTLVMSLLSQWGWLWGRGWGRVWARDTLKCCGTEAEGSRGQVGPPRCSLEGPRLCLDSSAWSSRFPPWLVLSPWCRQESPLPPCCCKGRGGVAHSEPTSEHQACSTVEGLVGSPGSVCCGEAGWVVGSSVGLRGCSPRHLNSQREH